MSGFDDKHRVTLEVNGQQAEDTLKKLRQQAQDWQTALARAAAEGDKVTMKKAETELRKVNREMRSMESNAQQAARVMQSLDKATPRELRRTLQQLKRELEGIERGSKAWEAQSAKIRRVQDELDGVNRSLRVHETRWQRFTRRMGDFKGAIMGGVAAVAGVGAAVNEAVKAYAGMEQEMANVSKFTGMTGEQVAALNEEFKKMDTRTSREELNRLAQEAGMLGKTAQEDVLGYVRAADVLNVALDDLGEDATLTLSKLTGIFGVEDDMGTERSLLAVGSVINELSQNCEASSGYLADFASRMGGVGAQAGMTIQQIMAFAAVLDSNNQNVEASSTALAQVLTRMYQEPAKYARVAGLDVEKFTNLLKNDANEALLTFLDALKGSGGMSELAPMFGEMGENGARAVAALSVLAGKVDEVRTQQQAANVAFTEATSVQKEFDVQNNTVQAGLEKQKKQLSELSVELGQRLLPLVQGAMSAANASMSVINAVVGFIIDYRKEILVAASAVAGYTVVVKAHTIATKAAAVASKAAAVAMRLFNNAMKANPAGLAVAAITALVTAIVSFTKWSDNATEAQKRLNKATGEMEASAASEERRLARLRAKLLAAKEGTDEYNAAKQEIVKNYGQYYDGLEAEIEKVGLTAATYDKLTAAIRRTTAAREYEKFAAEEQNFLDEALSETLDSIQEKLVDEYGEKAGYEHYEKLRNALVNGDLKYNNGNTPIGLKRLGDDVNQALKKEAIGHSWTFTPSAMDDINDYLEKVQEVDKSLEAFRKKWGDFAPGDTSGSGTTGGTGTGTNTGTETGTIVEDEVEDVKVAVATPATDRFAAEKAWRERSEALERIMYLQGKTNYEEYTRQMDEIAVEFYRKQLEHTELSADERLAIEAQYWEAKSKMEKNAAEIDYEKAKSDEDNRYDSELAELKQYYIDGKLTREQYEYALQQAELEHKRRMVQITRDGTAERLDAEREYNEAVQADQIKRIQDAEERERRHQDALQRLRERYFSMSPQERDTAKTKELDLLREAYEQELALAGSNEERKNQLADEYASARADIEKKYADESGEGLFNSYANAMNKVGEWLSSEGGQALLGGLQTATSAMSSIFSALTQQIQAEATIQASAVEKRYDKEIAAAQGNSFKVAKLEKEKEEATAKIKNEANKKAMNMQLIQAIAQTATGALNAYASAAAVPVIGYILAPIAAAAAIAAGMLQVNAIKKQQQAAEAQGYAEGGFTRPGGKYEPAGTVHAGEWVASQKLVNSPVTRPVIDMLEWAQRNNTIGSLRPADVSRSMVAQQTVAAAASDGGTLAATLAVVARSVQSQGEATRKLQQRLTEPFVTVNTVTGDSGIKKAQDDYNRLMRNKSPKSRYSKYQ